jgi:hypothetical protein
MLTLSQSALQPAGGWHWASMKEVGFTLEDCFVCALWWK